MKQSVFGKKEVPAERQKKFFKKISSSAPSERTESSCSSLESSERSESVTSSGRTETKQKPKLNRYKIYMVREEIVLAEDYTVLSNSPSMKIAFKTDGKLSCIREFVNKVEKL
jgi:hypothetical protein